MPKYKYTDLDREWISIPHAADLLQVTPNTIRRLMKLGAITTQHLPGCHPRVSRAQVLELATRSVQPAESVAAAGKPDA